MVVLPQTHMPLRHLGHKQRFPEAPPKPQLWPAGRNLGAVVALSHLHYLALPTNRSGYKSCQKCLPWFLSF